MSLTFATCKKTGTDRRTDVVNRLLLLNIKKLVIKISNEQRVSVCFAGEMDDVLDCVCNIFVH